MEQEKIAILDCGGQYTKVIDRKVRELFVKTDIFPVGIAPEKLKEYNAVILSGGPSSVWSEERLAYDEKILDLGLPVLGICYGMHLINSHFGGEVKPGLKTEYGETVIEVDTGCPLFDGLEKNQRVLMSHGDSIENVAPGFSVSGKSGSIIAALYDEAKRIYGVQFHPEVDLTKNGKQILGNFVTKIAGLKCDYRLEDRIRTSINMIQERVGEKKVIVLVSGGVDSAVTAALLVKALEPGRIYAIHVDHGFMRKDESDIICENLKDLGLTHLIRLDEEEFFLKTPLTIDGKEYPPLEQVSDPETKRNIIGHAFIEVVKKAMDNLDLDFDTTFLAQGTLRPDLIESGNPDISSHAHKIKTHHNDVSIIRRARDKGMVIETNWDWHKDEVRQVARNLGIDERIASRQPFPGPGLAIRTICSSETKFVPGEQTGEFDNLLNKLQVLYRGEVVPVNTVGVQGDCRSYRYLSIFSGNGYNIDWDLLSSLGTKIPNKLNFVNRVAYVLNHEKVGKIKNYPLGLNRQSLELLREVDHIVRKYLDKKPVSQVFAVLLPLGMESSGKKYSVAVRTFITNDFMTGRPAVIGKEISVEVLKQMVFEILAVSEEIDMVLYDVTGKPPATVEWE